jgi:integrase
MHIGESRYEAKKARREAGEKIWSYSDEKFHSHGSRNSYQQHILAFIQWSRNTHGVRRLDKLDERADELATEYLYERLEKSPYTLRAERAALRLFFSNRALAKDVPLPIRKRENITRSRQPTVREKEFQPANWQPLIKFLRATGLRRAEVRRLQMEDIQSNPLTGNVEVAIKKGRGKGGRPRQVPVLPGSEAAVTSLLAKGNPEQLVFPRIPSHLDVHALRREYAQTYYCQLSGRELPPATGRLKRSDYDEAAVLFVSRALGHNRKDVILRHYLR